MSEHPLAVSRRIARRWIIRGRLTLETPTHLGNGDADPAVDMPVLLDEATGRALLSGTSLAGALRNYLAERARGYFRPALRSKAGESAAGRLEPSCETAGRLMRGAELLFGGEKGDNTGGQGALIIEDALGGRPALELRDGVKINGRTRTAHIEQSNGRRHGSKYDLELLPAGEGFDLQLELLLPEDGADDARWALALGLQGLASGEIALGMRKRRGFGCCSVDRWSVTRYDLRDPAGLLAWLAADHPDWQAGPDLKLTTAPAAQETDIATLLDVPQADLAEEADRRRALVLDAHFRLDGSLLIRAGFDEQDRGPDTVHLESRHRTEGAERAFLPQPVLSGTSVAGALRGQARRIAATLAGDRNSPHVQTLIDGMFGPENISRGARNVAASRLVVAETPIRQVATQVQNRIRIDRFTGEPYESALYNEAPVFGGGQSDVQVKLVLRSPDDAEIGLLLLLLRDLWTGELPLGGESGVGRGRLAGYTVRLELPGEPAWQMEQTDPKEPLMLRPDGAPEADPLPAGLRDRLNGYVKALKQELQP